MSETMIDGYVSCVNCNTSSAEHRRLLKTRVIHRGRFYGQPLTIVACPNCGLVFQNPQPSAEQLNLFYKKDYYSGKAFSAEKRVGKKSVLMELLYRWLTGHLSEIDSWRILDIGAGYGQWLNMFDKSNKLLGIESSTQAIAGAKELFGIDMLNTDFMKSRLERGSFDLVTGLAVIEHFLDPLEALVAMNRILRKGGYLYLHTPDFFGMVLRKGIAKYFKIVHTFYYSTETLASLLEKAGFRVVASRRIPAVVETSSLWNPGNYFDGRLDIVAQKEQDFDPGTARQRAYRADDIDSVIRCYQETLKRDRLYHRVSSLRRHNIWRYPTALFLALCSAFAMIMVKKPRSKYDVLRERHERGL